MNLNNDYFKIGDYSICYAPDYHRLINRADVLYNLGMPCPKTYGECRDTIAMYIKATQAGVAYFWAITSKYTGRFIGHVELGRFNKTDMTCNIAYFVDERCRGMGIATRAVAFALEFVRGMPQYRIRTNVLCENIASIRVLQKNGFVVTAQRHDDGFNNNNHKAYDYFIMEA